MRARRTEKEMIDAIAVYEKRPYQVNVGDFAKPYDSEKCFLVVHAIKEIDRKFADMDFYALKDSPGDIYYSQ